MRLKFILALLLLAGLALGTTFWLKQHLGTTAPPLPQSETTPPPLTDSNAAIAVPSLPPEPVVAPAPATNVLTPEQRQEAIDAEVDRLQEWSMNDDPASLSNILADLTNTNQEVRDAAIEAAKQFGSTNAIPALKAAANASDNTREKIALLEAADFLSLPRLTFGQAPQLTREQLKARTQPDREKQAGDPDGAQNQPASSDLPPAPEQNPPPDTGQ